MKPEEQRIKDIELNHTKPFYRDGKTLFEGTNQTSFPSITAAKRAHRKLSLKSK